MERIDLIKRCQTGDKYAFEELYHLSCHQAIKTAYLISGQRGMAEDIVQEAFIRCYKEIRQLKEPDAFNSWFYKILIRCGWRLLAKNKALSLVFQQTIQSSTRIFVWMTWWKPRKSATGSKRRWEN